MPATLCSTQVSHVECPFSSVSIDSFSLASDFSPRSRFFFSFLILCPWWRIAPSLTWQHLTCYSWPLFSSFTLLITTAKVHLCSVSLLKEFCQLPATTSWQDSFQPVWTTWLLEACHPPRGLCSVPWTCLVVLASLSLLWGFSCIFLPSLLLFLKHL